MNPDFQKRVDEFNKELEALTKKYNVILLPAIDRHIGADIASLKIVDDLDPEMKRKYGLSNPQPNNSPILTN